MSEQAPEENTFIPPETQEEFDERVKDRLKRQRERYEAQIQTLQEELAQSQQARFEGDARREIENTLRIKGIDNPARIERILKYVDFDALEADEDGNPNGISVDMQLKAISEEMPDLLPQGYRVGAGSGQSKVPVFPPGEGLTREDVEKMTKEEINANWEKVQMALAQPEQAG
jgi:hypothetical protein